MYTPTLARFMDMDRRARKDVLHEMHCELRSAKTEDEKSRLTALLKDYEAAHEDCKPW